MDPTIPPSNSHSNHNAVLQLRQQELQRTLKPFLARGSKVIRCEGCLLPQADCICAFRPQACARSAVLMLMYTGEYFKPSNTGRLIADVALENFAFVWDRTQPAPALLTLLNDERYFPIVVFPTQYAAASRCISRLPERAMLGGDKIPLFIFLDGTWREAKKMFSKSPYLDKFPVIGIEPQQKSGYLLREAAHAHQLCTVEVGVEILRLAGDTEAAQVLHQYFQVFRRHYMAGKPHLQWVE